MDKKKIAISLTSIKERCVSHLRPFNDPLFSRFISIILSVWILSLTAYYYLYVPWLSLHGGEQSYTKQLAAEALKFHWVSVFLSRLPYLFYALILNFIAMLTGIRILRWLKVDFDSNIIKIIFSIPLGWIIYSVGIFYVGVSGLLYKEVVYCFLTLLGIFSILEIKRFFRGTKSAIVAWKASTTTSRFEIDKSDLVFLPIITIFITVQFVISFSPVWSPDALVYHMALPKLYVNHHALLHVPGFLFSTFPAHTEMLYLLGLITSGETLSKLFSFSISSMFLVTIFFIGNKYFSKEAGYLAVVIMMQFGLLFPIFFSGPDVDVALGLFSLLGVYAFFLWTEDMSLRQAQGKLSNEVRESRGLALERKDGYLYLAIICCASAAATKIQGLLFVLLFFVGFFVYGSGGLRIDRQFSKKLAWCILAVGIIALPWYIRSWWLTGDPIFPFLYKYLGAKNWNEYSKECLFAFLSNRGGAKSFSDFIRINKDLFFSGFAHSLSPIHVIFLIPLLMTLRNWNRLMRYLFSITLVCYIFFIFVAPRLRYYYVGLAILSIIVAHVIKTVWTKYRLTRIPILCIIIFSILPFLDFYRVVGKGPFFAGLGVLDQRQFFNNSPHCKTAMWVNENLPKDAKILSWFMSMYYLDREYLRVNPAFQSVLDFGRINDTPTFLKSIKELGITHLLCCDLDWTSPRVHVVKKFLDTCVFELLKDGKITLIKQIDSCSIYSIMAAQNYFVLDGNTIRFYDESHRRYLVKGWYSTEEWGTWSKGQESLITLNFKEPEDYTMLIKATGFSVPGKQQNVRIYLDDNLLGEHTFTHPTTHFEDFEMKIPSSYIKEGNQRIRFVYNFTGSPAEYGTSTTDARQLAMGVSSIEFK